MLKNKFIWLIGCFAICSSPFSQELNSLTRLSICEGYLTGKQALETIERKNNIKFSYNPQNFELNREIYLCKRNTHFKEIVALAVGREVKLLFESNHIIIKPSRVTKTVKVNISGRVESLESRNPIENATIKVNNEHVSTTNQFGYFSLTIETKADSLTLIVGKNGFTEYVSEISPSENFFRLFLTPEGYADYQYIPSISKINMPNVEDFWVTKLVVKENQVFVSNSPENLKDKPHQFSLLPNLGTYFSESGLYRFKRSYNLLAGYVGDVNGFEIGTGVNIVRNNLKGIQLAGISNIVGDSVSGAQLSLVSNVSIGPHKGIQSAIFSNTSWSHFKGVQLSSGVNIVKSKFTGFQAAMLNVCMDTARGVQLGLANFSGKTAYGVQLAPFINYANTNNTLQLATFVNATRENNSAQIGILNISIRQNKFQLGLLNLADTASGISIGLLSVVKNGYMHLDYSFSAEKFAAIKFKTGTHRFYNIINAGFRPVASPDIKIGYGVGSYKKLWKGLGFNTDIITSYVFENSSFQNNLNLLTQIDLELSYRVAHRVTLLTGIQLNCLFTNSHKASSGIFQSSIPSKKRQIVSQLPNSAMFIWPDFMVGLRF